MTETGAAASAQRSNTSCQKLLFCLYLLGNNVASTNVQGKQNQSICYDSKSFQRRQLRFLYKLHSPELSLTWYWVRKLHASKFPPSNCHVKLQQVGLFVLCSRKLSWGPNLQLVLSFLPPLTSAGPRWSPLPLLSLRSGFLDLFPIQASCLLKCPAVQWGLIIEPGTFRACVSWRPFEVQVLAIPATHSPSLSYITCCCLSTLCFDYCQAVGSPIFLPRAECRLENETQSEILWAEPWKPSYASSFQSCDDPLHSFLCTCG